MNIMIGLVQYEREIIVERFDKNFSKLEFENDVLKSSKGQPSNLFLAKELYNLGEDSVSEVSKISGISESVLYRYL